MRYLTLFISTPLPPSLIGLMDSLVTAKNESKNKPTVPSSGAGSDIPKKLPQKPPLLGGLLARGAGDGFGSLDLHATNNSSVEKVA